MSRLKAAGGSEEPVDRYHAVVRHPIGTTTALAKMRKCLMTYSRLRAILAAMVGTLALVACSPAAPDETPVGQPTTQTTTVQTRTPEPTQTPEPSNPLEEPLSGIVFIQSTGTGSDSDGFALYGLDPVSGKVTLQREFPAPTQALPVLSLFTPVFTSMSFDREFHRVAATSIDTTDGSTHVGWLTDTGEYVDVTAAVSASGGAFSGKVQHIAPAFGPDGAFYFADESIRSVMKVVADQATTPTDAVAVQEYEYSNPVSIWVYPSGTVQVDYGGSMPQVENVHAGVSGMGRVEDWLSDLTMVTGDSGNANLWLSDATEDPSRSGMFFGSGSDLNRVSLLPERVGRLSWNPVVSPDKTRIAFLSAPESGADPAQLFVVAADGGEPQLVPTTQTFQRLGSGGFFGPSSYVQLVDWR